MPLLPAQFAALEPFTDDWILPDSRARSARRLSTPYPEIERFYTAALALAPAALEYLSGRQLGELDAADTCLLKLMLALAEVGPAVEWYKDGGVTDGFPAERFPLLEQIPDCARQE